MNHSWRNKVKPKLPNILAKCLRVLLHLFKDHAHCGIAHNLLHLRVSHGPPLHLLWTVIPGVLTDHAALNSFSGFLKTKSRELSTPRTRAFSKHAAATRFTDLLKTMFPKESSKSNTFEEGSSSIAFW